MANWCSNSATFRGGDITSLHRSLMEGISVNDNGMGWLPVGCTGDRYLFSIVIGYIDEDSCFIFIESKWCPPLKELQYMADLFGCSMECVYEELGSDIYGRCVYDGKSLMCADLDEGDFVDDGSDSYLDKLHVQLMKKPLIKTY